jgi:hypothetical protein
MEILFTQLSPVEMTLMAVGILCAAVMRAFTGFGFALMAVPLLSLFLLPTDAVVLVALLTLTTSLVTYRAWWGRFGLSDGLPMVGRFYCGDWDGRHLSHPIVSSAVSVMDWAYCYFLVSIAQSF